MKIEKGVNVSPLERFAGGLYKQLWPCLLYTSESQVMEQYDINKLVKTIEALPEIYSDILQLKYSQGLSDSKIAELLGLPSETVRKRLQRAKLKLAKEIEKQETHAYAT